HAAKLAEIRQLIRSRDVTNRRKNRVLDNRPEQHAGTESRWLLRGPFQELCRRIPLVTDHEGTVLLADRSARAIKVEQRQAVVVRVDLRVIAARGQVGASQRGKLARLAGSR